MATDAAPPAPKIELPVDQDWLQSIINKKANTNGRIVSTKCSIIGEGKGFLSVVTRVLFEWEASAEDLKHLPQGIITKKPTMDKITLLDGPMKDFLTPELVEKAHNQEVDAYHFLNLHEPAPIPMARCFYGEKIRDADVTTGLLILEDLTHCAKSFHFNDDANVDAIMNMAGHIGKLQAYSLNHKEDFDKYISPQSDNPMDQMIKSMPALADSLRQQFPDKFKYSKEEFERILEIINEQSWLFEEPEKNGHQLVAVLGDVQPNNILWKTDAKGDLTPEVSAFIDFQVCNQGTAINDMGIMLFWTIPAEVRQKNVRKIMEHQLNTLKKHAKVPVTITIEQLMDLAAIATLCLGALFGLMVVDMMSKMKEMMGVTDERIQEMLDRLIAAIEESRERFKF